VELTDEELQSRAQSQVPPQKPYPGAALAKYAKLVSSASLGAITRP
jgi:dihydroxy-acid dehydratase